MTDDLNEMHLGGCAAEREYVDALAVAMVFPQPVALPVISSALREPDAAPRRRRRGVPEVLDRPRQLVDAARDGLSWLNRWILGVVGRARW